MFLGMRLQPIWRRGFAAAGALVVFGGFALCGIGMADEPAVDDLPPIVAPPPGNRPPETPTGPETTIGPETHVEPIVPDTPGDDLVATQPAFFVNVAVDHADGRYQEGDTLSVQFQSERDAHVYLLYHQVDGSCVMLYPNKAHTDSRVQAKTPITIPQPGEAFRFRVRAPFGVEALQLVASDQPIAVLEALDTSAGRAVPIPQTVLEKLAERMKAEPDRFAEHRVRVETRAAAILPPPKPASRVALFVGVDEYMDPNFCEPHPQFRNSVERLSKAMLEKGGLDPERVKILTGKQSTRANIEEHIMKWLPSVSAPGDTVFIVYAGHGGRVKNDDGSEADGYDELITTYDNALGNFSNDAELNARLRATTIVDDVLARWIQELSGRQVVMIMDTCHGGGQIDEAGISKGLSKFFGDESQRVKDISQMNTLVIVGCGPDESVWFPADDEAELLMSKSFCEAISEFEAPVSIRQAYELYFQRTLEFLAEADMYGVQLPTIQDNILMPIYLVP